jgi:FdhD protein
MKRENPKTVPAETTRRVATSRCESGRLREARDVVACEEPLEIQLDGAPFVVVMRTPGADRELALGLLLAEGVIGGAKDVASVHHESVAPDPDGAGNVIRVNLRPEVRVDLEALRRNLWTNASCGLCGKTTIEAALRRAPPVDDRLRLGASFFAALPERLREAQEVFAATGGLHAAALFDRGAKLLVVHEDVGRHNAVDKVVGWAVERELLPLTGHVLLVSGRISFEVAQKALAARIPVVAAVSAPSSLAVSLAEEAGMALVGFLRGGGFNVYGHRERIGA